MSRPVVWAVLGTLLGLVATMVIVLVAVGRQSTDLAASATATPTKTPTKITPPPSPTSTTTDTPFPTDTAPALAATIALSPTETLTPSTTPAITIVPLAASTSTTPTATPVPRTLRVAPDLPQYPEVADHFLLTHAFPDAPYWGSQYYPYGTNAGGQYFWHFGIDIEGNTGRTIMAVGDGVVVHAGPDDEVQLGPWRDFYGQAVVIKHDQQWQGQDVFSLYGHVSKVLVREGMLVKAGEPIARVGQLGVATGPHLHLEVRLGRNTYDDTRNPALWLAPDPGYGVIAGRVVDYRDYYVPQQLVTLHFAEAPSRFWRQTFTYPDGVVNSDDAYSETFVFSDVPAGNYVVRTAFDGRQITVPVHVANGQTSFVPIYQDQAPRIVTPVDYVTELPPTPTVAPPPTPLPQPTVVTQSFSLRPGGQ